MKHGRSLILLLLLLGMASLGFAQTNCLSFDGSNDYVGFGDILDMGTSDWSYQIWFKTTSANGGLMGKSILGSVAGRWSISFSASVPGKLVAVFQGNSSVALYSINATGAWNDGNWHNATVTCDRDGDMTLYMDGTYNNKLSISASSAINMNTAGHFFIGTYGNAAGTAPAAGWYFKGSLDEARVWNKCLTPAEVAANWDTQISPSADNLMGYWRMNEGTGTTLTDLSGENYHGTLYPLPSGSGPSWSTLGPETLPVELSSFTGFLNAYHDVVLTWVTQSETAVMGFYIYRGTNPDLAKAQQISAMIEATNTSYQNVYVFEDQELSEIGTYYYWLMVSDIDGSESFHGPIHVLYENTQPGIPEIPHITALNQVYPNPFNPSANISYRLAKQSDVSIAIYNNRGQRVRSFDLGTKAAGSWNLTWDGKDQNGSSLSSGVYYIRMQAGPDSFFKKAVLMK